MPTASDVFLSYPHKDHTSARALAAALRAEGLTVWVDESNVGAFEHIHDRVASGIAGSRAVLAWYSRQYAASRPCQWELGAAWLCEGGDRILVVNPEESDEHIQPRSLVNRAYVGAEDIPAVAHQVKNHLARFTSAIGDAVSFSQPLHYGRQLTGLPHFVGRNDHFWKLHDALSESGATMLTGATRAVVQLRGFGGVGKSVLAEEYALRFGAAYPGGIFWLKAYGNADVEETRPENDDDERHRQLSDFATHLHIPTEGRSPAEIRAALAQVLASGRRSLWIVDDLPSGLKQEAIREWLSPHASVPTLITTRDRSHSRFGSVIDLDVLSNEEAFALLETHRPVGDSERRAAWGLLDALAYHALAVEVTGSYLAEQQSVSFEQFLDELRRPGEDVLRQAAELADALPFDHSPCIIATLTSSIHQLKEPGRDLLRLASCLATAPIPKELIEAVFARLYAKPSTSSERMKAAKETGNLSLTRREPAPVDALSVHTLVARTARRHPDLKGGVGEVQAAAVASLTEVLRGMFSLGTILRQGLFITHARALTATLTTAEEALLLVLVANTHLNRGDLETAERLARRALDYCRAELGDETFEASCARSALAMVMLARGDSAGAREILETVVPVFGRTQPPGDLFRIGAQLGLAAALAGQGDLPAAGQLGEAALSASTDAHGSDHPLTLGAKTLLLTILSAAGDIRRAARLEWEVRAARSRIADTADVDNLADQIIVARAKIGSGEIESVAPEIEKAVEVFGRELGEDSVLTLNAKLLRLILLGSRGEVSETRQLAGELIPRFEELFGPHNPATLQARFAEALAFLCADDSRPALSLLEPLVPELEAALGANHAEVWSAKVCLAQARHSDDDAEGARRILDALIPAAEVRFGPAHAVTLNAKECLALCLADQGDRGGACEVWAEVAALREGMLGGDHPEVLGTKLLIAQSLALLGQYQRCSELLHRVVPLAEARLGPQHEITLMFKVCEERCRMSREHKDM